MADSAPGITAALEATGDVQVVANSAFGGWGLSTDKTWATDLPRIIDQYHPEIVIGTWSWDDELAQQDPQAYLVELIRAPCGPSWPRATASTWWCCCSSPRSGPTRTSSTR